MTTYSPEYYADLERRLGALLQTLRATLPAEPASWASEHLDAGEYGLAFEVISETLGETGLQITAGIYGEMKSLADLMGLGSKLQGLASLVVADE